MKKILTTIAISLLSFISVAQLSTVEPDTVCFGTTTLSNYTVPSVGAGTYTWTVTGGGVITSGQGSNSITVNWSAAPVGLINNGVSVSYVSGSGCPAVPVDLNILIYQVNPTITALGPFCVTDGCVNLVGTPAGGTFTGTGVVGGQFCPQTAGAGTHTITYTYSNAGCTFTTTTSVTVTPQPVLSPIQHD